MTPSRSSRGFFLNVAPALLYVLAIFYVGSIPNPPGFGLTFSAKDKLLHLLAFGGMQVVFFRALRRERPALSLGRQLLVAVALTSAVGGLLELWQALLPNRTAEFLDWVADTAGAGVSAAVAALIYRQATTEIETE